MENKYSLIQIEEYLRCSKGLDESLTMPCFIHLYGDLSLYSTKEKQKEIKFKTIIIKTY